MLDKPQIACWQNNVTLYAHTLAVTDDNYLACDWLGQAVRDLGGDSQALDLFTLSVKINPHYLPAEKDLAEQLLTTGHATEAIEHLRAVSTVAPNDSEVQHNLGILLVTHGQTEEGINHYEQALKLEPGSPSIKNQLAWTYATVPYPKFRNGPRAVQLARQACNDNAGSNPCFLHDLATNQKVISEKQSYSDPTLP